MAQVQGGEKQKMEKIKISDLNQKMLTQQL